MDRGEIRSSAIETGQVIAGHYRLVERIGSGGTGVVWRAVDERLERSVAIKQILTQPSLPPGEKDVVRQRAAREARNAARFQHPNAIVVFDIVDHEGDPCLIMEYLPSRSLALVLSAQGMLPLPQVARIGEQVASALVAAHRAGIVHRDVKPGNVLLGENGTVKITDFGISKAKGDVSLTATGLISGTAAYLAPEVARGAQPTPAADVFALGATLFHALEGQPPYGSNPNPLALLYAAANGQLSQPRNAGPLTDLLLSLLSFEPEDRPPMGEVRDELLDFADYASDGEPNRMLANRRSAARPVPTLDRRPAQAEISTAEMMSSTATVSDPQFAALPEPYSYEGVDQRSLRRRKPLLFVGGFAAGLVMVAVVLFALVTFSGPTPVVKDPTTPLITPPRPSATSTAPSGQTRSTGKVQVSEAADVVDQFYGDLAEQDFSDAYNKLTPTAQRVYGNLSAFQTYWTQNRVQRYSSISAASGGGANADGSVDMQLESLTYGEQTKSVRLRVVSADRGLLIDSDTQ